jgi:HAT (Half-A-TPR) repeat
MELRYNEVERARGIYERYVRCLPEVKSWVRYAKFEMKSGDVARARAVYERSVQELEGEANMVNMSNHAVKEVVLLLSGLRDVRGGSRQPHLLGAKAVL